MPKPQAYVVFSGPEMPCMLQHAILFARDAARRGGQGQVFLEGQAPRWLPLLQEPGHSLFRVFAAARDEGLIGGVCRGCAAVHDVVGAAESMGLPLLADAFGHVSLTLLREQGFEVTTL